MSHKEKSCIICNKPMRKKDSVHQIFYICSKICNDKRRTTLPKSISPITKEYWIKKGFTEEEATCKVSEQQRKRSNASPEHWTHKGYSLEESKILANNWQYQSAAKSKNLSKELKRLYSHRCIEFWMAKGMSLIEAQQAVSKANTLTSIDAFIKRYGEIEGKNRYDQSCITNKYNLSIERYIKDFGEIDGIELWRKKFDNGNGSSKIATKIFKEVMFRLGDNFLEKAYFKSETNKEFGKMGKDKKYYFFDFVIPSLKLCIEINGAFHHADPQKYNSGDIIQFGGKTILVDDLWEKDKIKRKVIETDGYTMIEIWFRKESDFESIVNKCINLIKGFQDNDE